MSKKYMTFNAITQIHGTKVDILKNMLRHVIINILLGIYKKNNLVFVSGWCSE